MRITVMLLGIHLNDLFITNLFAEGYLGIVYEPRQR